MVKKLSKHGNSMALIIDKPILELLNISENTQLKITTDGETITIIPINGHQDIDDTIMRKRVKDIAENVMNKYASALKKLAHDE